MLTQEPRLQRVSVQNFANNQIVRAVVTEFGGAAHKFANLPINQLVGVQ